jgi:drug/metabolite transporter (DMT)-like permease
VKRAGLAPGTPGREAGPLLALAAWQLMIGSLPLLGASAVFEPNAGITWNIEFVGLLLFLALVGTSFTTALWYWLLQRMEVGRLTMFLFLVPVVGLGIAALAFGERVGPLELGAPRSLWPASRRWSGRAAQPLARQSRPQQT